MPIYAYRCEACGHAQDVLRKISDPLLSTCPACGADRFRKQVTSAGFQLKGSGWYATDFRNAGAPKPAASEGAGATASAEADGAKAGAEPKAAPAAGEGAAAPAAPKAPPAAAPAASPAAPAR